MSEISFGGHKITAQKDYSSVEQLTGQYWINGKPIYRKVFKTKTGGTYGDTSTPNTVNITNAFGGNIIDDMIIQNGVLQNGDGQPGQTVVAMNSAKFPSSFTGKLAEFWYNRSGDTIYVRGQGYYANCDCILVFEYTKTTD